MTAFFIHMVFYSMWAVLMCYRVAEESMVSHFKITHLPSTPFQRTFRFRLLLLPPCYAGIRVPVFTLSFNQLTSKVLLQPLYFCIRTLMKFSNCSVYVLWRQGSVSLHVSQIEQASEAHTRQQKPGCITTQMAL